MWARYRKWKHALVLPLFAVGWLSLKFSPDGSIQQKIGLACAVLFWGGYLVEEVVWIAQKRGRPCPACGQRLDLKPFRIYSRCPYCKKSL
jgi:hypothetical protein